MTPEELNVFLEVIKQAVRDAGTSNKVWIGIAAGGVSLLGILVGAGSQMLIAWWQRRTQERLTMQQTTEQRRSVDDQLAMQELTSRRMAIANIADKRQVWIDELRSDMAIYLATWQEISWRWQAMVGKRRDEPVTDEELSAFSQPIAAMRRDAHEIYLRIVLRLNPREEPHKKLHAHMLKLELKTQDFQRDRNNTPTDVLQREIRLMIHEITTMLQGILKDEWDRLKKEYSGDGSKLETI